jgi:hypothetical protein
MPHLVGDVSSQMPDRVRTDERSRPIAKQPQPAGGKSDAAAAAVAVAAANVAGGLVAVIIMQRLIGPRARMDRPAHDGAVLGQAIGAPVGPACESLRLRPRRADRFVLAQLPANESRAHGFPILFARDLCNW